MKVEKCTGCGKIFVAHCTIDKYCSETCSKEVKHNILRNIFATVWHKKRRT
jgi:hypothetical protein